MTAPPLVADPSLVSVLSAASTARQQALSILDFLDQHHTASSEINEDILLALSKQQKLLNAHLAQLRGLNRKAILGVRSTKQETAEARQEIDSLHLQLQNLYYEQRHLKGEIGACEEYDHKYMTLPLIPTDEFLALHPEHESSNEHDLTIARLEDEHKARQALEERRQTLLRKKDALVKETGANKDELNKLDAEIEKWVAGESVVRQVFDMREKKMADARENETS